MMIATTTRVTAAVTHHRQAGAWSRPPDGAAARRKRLIPAHMTATASQSRPRTRGPERRATGSSAR